MGCHSKNMPQLPALKIKTLQFVNAIAAAHILMPIKEAALFINCTSFSNSIPPADGHLMGGKECLMKQVPALAVVTHVWEL